MDDEVDEEGQQEGVLTWMMLMKKVSKKVFLHG